MNDIRYLQSLLVPVDLTVLAESSVPDAGTLAPVLPQVVREIDPEMPYSHARTMRDFYDQRAVKTMNAEGRVGS